jgi:hypothetical protein
MDVAAVIQSHEDDPIARLLVRVTTFTKVRPQDYDLGHIAAMTATPGSLRR